MSLIIYNAHNVRKVSTTEELPTIAPLKTITDLGITELDNNDLYIIHSSTSDTFALLFTVHYSLGLAGNESSTAVLYQPVSIRGLATVAPSTDDRLLKVLDEKGSINAIRVVQNDVTGFPYTPGTFTEFNNSAISGVIYIHIKSVSSGVYHCLITNHLGLAWDDNTGDFTQPSLDVSGEDQTGVAYTPITTHLPASIPADGTGWFPLAAGVSDNSSAFRYKTVSFVNTTLAADINADEIYTNTTAPLKAIDADTAHIVDDTKSIVFPILSNVSWQHDEVPLYGHLLPVNTLEFTYPKQSKQGTVYNTLLPNPVPLALRLDMPQDLDEDWWASLASVSSINLVLQSDSAVVPPVVNPLLPTIVIPYTGTINKPSIPVEIVNDGDDIAYTANRVYVYRANSYTDPIMAVQAIILPATYAKYALKFLGSAPTPGIIQKYRGGTSLYATYNGNHIEHNVNGSKNNSIANISFSVTPNTEYRISFRLRNRTALDLNTDTGVDLYVGVSEADIKSISHATDTSTNVTSYNPRDPHRHWLLKLTDNTTNYTLIQQDNTTTPGVASSITTHVDGSSVLKNWTGETLYELGIVKASTTTATLSLYLNGVVSFTATVPWIESGTLVNLLSSSISLSDPEPSVTQDSYIFTPDDASSAYIAPPTSPPGTPLASVEPKGYTELYVKELNTIPPVVDRDPYTLYVEKGTLTTKLVLPTLKGAVDYMPNKYIEVPNYPYTTGSFYNVISQRYDGATLRRSFLTDDATLTLLPSVTNEGVAIYQDVDNDMVHIYTGPSFTTLIGSFSTLDDITQRTVYTYNPYLLTGVGQFRLEQLVNLRPSSSILNDTDLLLDSDEGAGSGVVIPFKVASDDVENWTLSFNRRTIGTYGLTAKFIISIRPYRASHNDVQNPSDFNAPLKLNPLPLLRDIKLTFGNSTTSNIGIELSNTQGYSYGSPITPVSRGVFSPFNGNKTIHIQIAKLDNSTELKIYEENTVIARALLPVPYMYSGSIFLSHVNPDYASNELLTKLTFKQTTVLNQTANSRGIAPTPTKVYAYQYEQTSGLSTSIYKPKTSSIQAYVDVYIRNPAQTSVLITLSLMPANDSIVDLYKDLEIGAGQTKIFRDIYIDRSEQLYLKSNSIAIVRTVGVEQLS